MTDTPSLLALPDQVMPPNLFVLPTTQQVVFPSLMAPIQVSEPRFVASVEEALTRQRMIGLLVAKDSDVSADTTLKDLYLVGVAVRILKRIKMPDGSVSLLVHSAKRFRVKKLLSEKPHVIVEAEYLDDVLEKSLEMDALMRSVVGQVKKLSETNPFFSDEMRLAMVNAPGPGTVADLVVYALQMGRKEAQSFLETLSVKERFEKLLVSLKREQDVADVQRKIQDDVNQKVSTMQREFFLREQLKAIKSELGLEEDGKSKNSRTFRERIEASKMPPDVKKAALEEVAKFETLSETSPEYNVSRNYLDVVCALPWGEETVDNLGIAHAREVLERDHFGLEKIKDRIIEFLAVRKLLSDRARAENKEALPPKASIICLVGPPGVGKTSIGKSVAEALGRKFYRFSLGGMRDEAEIKGHRRTYVGALPGKILQALRRAGTKNPVLMLDEIDKLGQSYQGDPASALLEVLDPEQNHSFLDHYLDLPFDLSRVLFVATANTTSTIPAALLDRMEVIELPGYTLEEKEVIANRYVLPKVLEENGLAHGHVKIDKSALRRLMEDYAREPGLRVLQQLLARIARKVAAELVAKREKGVKTLPPVTVAPEDLKGYLGPERYYNEVNERVASPGVVVGLAWTPTGGDILFIEAQSVPGSGQLKLTGQMGDVMTESAAIAWSFIRKEADRLGLLPKDYFKKNDVHVHIPAGAIPKDGPSAGVTMSTALFSLFSKRLSKRRIAMTGEISLTGRVLPVGGLKEKILAARRVGIYELILPKLNEKDMSEVPEYALKGMTLHFVSHVQEAIDLALVRKGKKASLTTKGKVLVSKRVKVKKKLSLGSRRPGFRPSRKSSSRGQRQSRAGTSR